MNAYELADKLENEDRLWSIEEQLMIDVCHMLRQQANRIAELEKFNKAILKKGGYPHKPLSDEEIWNWFKENTALTKESALRIARAIEERHGIK